MRVGDLFFSQKDFSEHLMVVIGRSPKTGDVLAVSITSYRERGDKTCVLGAGVHPALTRTSMIAYGYARAFTIEQQKDFRADRGNALRPPPMRAQILSEIVHGLYLSPHTPPELVRFAQANDIDSPPSPPALPAPPKPKAPR